MFVTVKSKELIHEDNNIILFLFKMHHIMVNKTVTSGHYDVIIVFVPRCKECILLVYSDLTLSLAINLDITGIQHYFFLTYITNK